MTSNTPENNPQANPEVIKAFDKVWYYFPFPVFLLQKNRTIVSMNKAAKEMGVVTGMKCFQLTGDTGIHEGCLGNSAMKDEEGKRAVAFIPGINQVIDSYWLPIPGEKNMMIHFGVDITEYAKPEMFPAEE